MQHAANDRHGERGSAGVKMLVVLGLIALCFNAGYNYIPTAYQAEAMRTDMETALLQGISVPGKVGTPVDNVKGRLIKAREANELPPETIIEVKQQGTAVVARIAYAKNVALLPFGIFNYLYVFDHTVTPTGFLMKSGPEA